MNISEPSTLSATAAGITTPAPSLAGLGRALGRADERGGWRLVFECLTQYRCVAAASRPGLLEARPEPTRSFWDAVLGALAEFLALEDSLEIPGWALEPSRFLDACYTPPYSRATPALRRYALIYAPASFVRRGVLVERRDLAGGS